MSAWTIYWITRLDALNALFLFFTIVLLIALATVLINWSIEFIIDSTYVLNKKTKTICSYIIFLLSISVALLAIVPSSKEMAAIIVVPKISNAMIESEIPQKIMNLADDWLEKFEPKNKK